MKKDRELTTWANMDSKIWHKFIKPTFLRLRVNKTKLKIKRGVFMRAAHDKYVADKKEESRKLLSIKVPSLFARMRKPLPSSPGMTIKMRRYYKG